MTMSLQLPLGPLFVGLIEENAGFYDSHYALTPDDRAILEDPLVGGVILFDRNFESREQLTALVADIRRLRNPALLVAIDQEGGRVQRLNRDGFSMISPMDELGLLYDKDPEEALDAAEQIGSLVASELLSIGIDLSYAPVLDINANRSSIIGTRAFHENPHVIAQLAEHFILGMHRAGMAAVGKHFPGHGHVVEDSHEELPTDERLLDTIQELDVYPYQYLIACGLLDAVMTAHVVYKEADAVAATFSPFWLQRVLRHDLGFQGVIFSDDILMHATDVMGTPLERTCLAQKAGCDMVLVCNDRAVVKTILADTIYRENSLKEANSRHERLLQLRRYQKNSMTWDNLVESNDYKIAQDALNSLKEVR